MSDLADKLRINLNQNLWGLIVSLISLGASEHYGLRYLLCFSIALSALMTVSIAVTTLAYTMQYWRHRRS